MPNTFNIAIDPGKGYCKVAYVQLNKENKPVGDIKTFSFPSRYEDFSPLRENSSIDNIEIDGLRVCVGNDVLENATSTENTKNEPVHKYCIYTALAKILGNGDVANVAIGCPIDIYKNVEARKQYKDDMLPKGTLRFKFNGSDVHFEINKRIVCSEAISFIFGNDEYKTGEVGVIDLGYLNLNACQFDDGEYVNGSDVTLKYGAGVFERNVKQALLNKEEIAPYISKKNILKYISQGFMDCVDENVKEMSKPIITKAVNDILSEIKETLTNGKWSNIKAIKVVFIGGTSVFLKDRLKDIFPNADIKADDTARFANVKAFLTML